MYAADEGDCGDRADQRNAQDERAEGHHHRVETGDEGDAEEIAAQGPERPLADDVGDGPRHAEVPLRPSR